jgi:hypothetical protein
MLFSLWSPSIRLEDISLRVFPVVEFSNAAFPLRRGYYAYYLCSS